MLRGVYTAASAMLAQETAQSVIAHNLANVNTPGYKADVAAFQSYRLAALTRVQDNGNGNMSDIAQAPIGDLGAGAAPADISLDLTDGTLRQTGNPLDVAARGNEYFVVRAPAGDRLTRAGEFTLGPDGTLMDTSGYPVVGKDGGLIRLDTRAVASIDAHGQVVSNGKTEGSLKIVALSPGTRAVKEGNRLMRPENGTTSDVSQPTLVPGSLETSNVTVVEEMVSMITAMRAYEAAQKAVQSEDEMLGRAVNDVTKV